MIWLYECAFLEKDLDFPAPWAECATLGPTGSAEDLVEARGSQMKFGREPAAAAADGLRALFSRAPVPSGGTLMLVLSILTISILKRRMFSNWSSSNTRSSTPAFAHLLMRV